jgi:hypothetical protein
MNNKSEFNILLTFLIILSVLSFVRTFIYILFDKQLINADKYLGINIDVILEGILTIFAIVCSYIATIVLIKRGVGYDLLTAALSYLILAAFIRFYYEYLYFNKNNPKQKYYIDKFQDLDALAIFIASAYIMYFLFLTKM